MILDASVDGRPHRVEVTGGPLRYTVTIDGRRLDVDWREAGGAFVSLLTAPGGQSHQVALETRPGGYRVLVGSDEFAVELLEAARVDGANEIQVFRGIVLPLLAPTIAVVATTIVIYALKTFDVVYTMTSGNFDTNVIANVMYQELFNNNQQGRAAAIAVILLIAIIPVMIINVRRFREQEAIR